MNDNDKSLLEASVIIVAILVIYFTLNILTNR